jgi:glycosyltransferase involved in cell wall biosynthesis
VAAPPPVSVLLPVRDGAAHLAEAIGSLEQQTFEDFEVIAVDDGSTDETADMLSAWARRDERVRVTRQDAAGIVAALERGRAEASGRYLARMDADDVSEPGRLAEQFALMESDRRVALCGSGVRYFPASEVRDGARRYEEWLNAALTHDDIVRDVFVECPIPHPTFFMRASAIESVGGYRDMGWPEDYDVVLRLWAAGARFAKVRDALLRWREGPARLSRTDARYGPDAFLACKVHFLRGTLLSAGREVVVWGAGPVGKSAARELTGAGTRVRAFVEVDPDKIGQEIHGAPVLDVAAGLALRGVRHLAAVGQPGARGRLRALLSGGGFEELRDFVAIA